MGSKKIAWIAITSMRCNSVISSKLIGYSLLFVVLLNLLVIIIQSLYQDTCFMIESLKIMLLCGSDLLESFTIPGVWIRDQVSLSAC